MAGDVERTLAPCRTSAFTRCSCDHTPMQDLRSHGQTTITPGNLAVHAEPPDDPAVREAAHAVAMRFGLELGADRGMGLRLVRTAEALELRDDEPGCLPLHPQLTNLDAASPAGRSRRQPLARAVGLRRGQPLPRVLDATAGLGEDAWLLASWGCAVTCCERNAVVAALLDDALRRAGRQHPETAQRITLWVGDVRALAASVLEAVDVVYLDPMFPPGRKTLERRPLRLLRGLVGDDADAAALLTWARGLSIRRVVVKRPRRATVLAEAEPAVVFHGKAVRWDVYMRPS